MSPREKRIIRNEELFREVNAHIANLEERLGAEADLMPLVCECASTGCATVIEVDRGTFQTVRQDPLLFVVAPGHELEEEKVVGRGAGYLIIEKDDGR